MNTSKAIAYGIAALPVLFLGQCMYNEISQRSDLSSLCAGASRGASVRQVLEAAASNRTLKARTGGPAGKDEREWFDREYLRIGAFLRQSKKLVDDYSVVFAKPGVGYYACIVIHKEGRVTEAWFEDRSN